MSMQTLQLTDNGEFIATFFKNYGQGFEIFSELARKVSIFCKLMWQKTKEFSAQIVETGPLGKSKMESSRET